MRGKSHMCLGSYLAEHYLTDVPKVYIRAFLIGCIEPDRNPATYLKGSFRNQWLRGHNYLNARRYMARISQRLERKESSYFTANASNIGFGWWSHDIGGHMFGYRDDELTARWVQLVSEVKSAK